MIYLTTPCFVFKCLVTALVSINFWSHKLQLKFLTFLCTNLVWDFKFSNEWVLKSHCSASQKYRFFLRCVISMCCLNEPLPKKVFSQCLHLIDPSICSLWIFALCLFNDLSDSNGWPKKSKLLLQLLQYYCNTIAIDEILLQYYWNYCNIIAKLLKVL